MTHHSLKYTGQWIIVDIRPASSPLSRLGVTVTKRFGCACQRNRFKRMVRESFRLTYLHFAIPLDILVKPRSQAMHAHMPDIQNELLAFVNQALLKLRPQDECSLSST